MRKPIFSDMLTTLVKAQEEPFTIIAVNDKKWVGCWAWEWCNKYGVRMELYPSLPSLKEGMKKYDSREAIILVNSYNIDQPWLLDAWQLAKSYKSDIKLYHTYTKWFMNEHDSRLTNPLLRMMPMQKSYTDRVMTIKERMVAYEERYKDVIKQVTKVTTLQIQTNRRIHTYA